MGKESSGKLRQKDIDRLVQAQIDANRVNQVTPTGSLTFRGNTATTTLSPEEQAILAANQAGRLQAGQVAGVQLGDLAGGRDAVEQATFNRLVALLNPQFDRQERTLQQRLANQGLPQTSGAYNREYGRFEDTRNQALEQAGLQAVLAGENAQTAGVQRALALLGLGFPVQPQFINVPQVTVPFQQPGGGSAGPLPGLLGLAGLGAGLALGGPYGATVGLQAGQAGFGIGSSLPYLFG